MLARLDDSQALFIPYKTVVCAEWSQRPRLQCLACRSIEFQQVHSGGEVKYGSLDLDRPFDRHVQLPCPTNLSGRRLERGDLDDRTSPDTEVTKQPRILPVNHLAIARLLELETGFSLAVGGAVAGSPSATSSIRVFCHSGAPVSRSTARWPRCHEARSRPPDR